MAPLRSCWMWWLLALVASSCTATTVTTTTTPTTMTDHQLNNDWACSLEKWTLEERQNRSQVVFTAVIESTVRDEDAVIDVRVKKVFKGLDRGWEGRLVRVEGLSDPALCPSRVRLRDTRIFLANRPPRVNHTSGPLEDDLTADHLIDDESSPSITPSSIRLRLNSSLISVSLRHLQQLRAFTQGIRYATLTRPTPFIPSR